VLANPLRRSALDAGTWHLACEVVAHSLQLLDLGEISVGACVTTAERGRAAADDPRFQGRSGSRRPTRLNSTWHVLWRASLDSPRPAELFPDRHRPVVVWSGVGLDPQVAAPVL
jgi:hypothetical protein